MFIQDTLILKYLIDACYTSKYDLANIFHIYAERRTNTEGNVETWWWEMQGRGEVDAWKAKGRREILKGTKMWTQAYE